MAFSKLLLSSALLIGLAASANAQTVFIDNANVAPGKTADIIVVDQIIKTVGSELRSPENAQVMSGDELWVTPGMFAALTGLGMVEIGAEDSTDDRRAKDAETSLSDLASDGFNPKSPIIDNTRVAGITHAGVIGNPSHNIFAGTGFIANMSGEFDSVEKDKAFIFVQLGSRGGKLAGGSRSAAISQFRNALFDAKTYSVRFGAPHDGDALSRRDAAELRKVARGQMPIIIGADRASDLLRIIELTEEFGLDVIISGGAEAWMVADELKAANMRLIIDPVANLPGSFDRVGARIDNPKLLAEAGVEFALMSFSESTTHNVRILNQHAGNAVANGLSWETAMASISSIPADWFGIDVGSANEGSDTFVVWDGDPLQVTSTPLMVVIDGAEQSMMSRQRELRDRYNPTREDNRAHKYR